MPVLGSNTISLAQARAELLGSDFAGILDIDPALTIVSGARCLAEALGRRLTTPRGRLLGDPDYGFDLRQYVNSGFSDPSVIEIGIENECLKDERVRGCSATVSYNASTQTITADIAVKISDEDGFPFTLTISDLSASVLLPPGEA